MNYFDKKVSRLCRKNIEGVHTHFTLLSNFERLSKEENISCSKIGLELFSLNLQVNVRIEFFFYSSIQPNSPNITCFNLPIR